MQNSTHQAETSLARSFQQAFIMMSLHNCGQGDFQIVVACLATKRHCSGILAFSRGGWDGLSRGCQAVQVRHECYCTLPSSQFQIQSQGDTLQVPFPTQLGWESPPLPHRRDEHTSVCSPHACFYHCHHLHVWQGTGIPK